MRINAGPALERYRSLLLLPWGVSTTANLCPCVESGVRRSKRAITAFWIDQIDGDVEL